jgi:hypothetical protein
MVTSTRGAIAGLSKESEPDVGLEQLEHLVLVVFCKRGGKNNAILRACKHNGIDSPWELAMYQNVDTLNYVREGVTHNLDPGSIGLINNFKGFAAPLEKRDRAAVQWMEITHEDWMNNMAAVIGEFCAASNSNASGTPNVATSTTKVSSPLQEFEKGIRRDRTAYLVVKDNKAWDSWRRSTIATARTHKCEEIFDPLYIREGFNSQLDIFFHNIVDCRLIYRKKFGLNKY